MSLVFLDLETTGLQTDTSHIVDLALCDGDGMVLLHSLVNPGCPIPAEATAVHGITDAMVASAPRFAALAEEVQAALTGAVLVGYNSRAFDTLILNTELRRAGQPGIDLDAVVEIDLYRAWQRLEPRTLAGALKRYLGYVIEQPCHRALNDTLSLPPLLEAMVEHHALRLDDVVRLSRPDDEVDRSGKLRRGEDGIVRFAFGKYDGQPVAEHTDYAEWMLGKDFPADTKKALRQVLSHG